MLRKCRVFPKNPEAIASEFLDVQQTEGWVLPKYLINKSVIAISLVEWFCYERMQGRQTSILRLVEGLFRERFVSLQPSNPNTHPVQGRPAATHVAHLTSRHDDQRNSYSFYGRQIWTWRHVYDELNYDESPLRDHSCQSYRGISDCCVHTHILLEVEQHTGVSNTTSLSIESSAPIFVKPIAMNLGTH